MKLAVNTRPLAINNLVLNSAGLLLIYFTPALSHLLNFPLYLIEPMRLVLIVAMLHSDRRNAYLLALTLPVFSFAVSAHPVFYKMLLISAELSLNVWLFFMLRNKFRNDFAAMLSAIVISKVAYYLLKFGFIYFALIGTGLFSTPIWIQVVTSFIFSAYAFMILRNSKKEV